jgi:hypothetical protein
MLDSLHTRLYYALTATGCIIFAHVSGNSKPVSLVRLYNGFSFFFFENLERTRKKQVYGPKPYLTHQNDGDRLDEFTIRFNRGSNQQTASTGKTLQSARFHDP